MKRRTTPPKSWPTLRVLATVIVISALGISGGCGPSQDPPSPVLGEWVTAERDASDEEVVILNLNSDATASMRVLAPDVGQGGNLEMHYEGTYDVDEGEFIASLEQTHIEGTQFYMWPSVEVEGQVSDGLIKGRLGAPNGEVLYSSVVLHRQ